MLWVVVSGASAPRTGTNGPQDVPAEGCIATAAPCAHQKASDLDGTARVGAAQCSLGDPHHAPAANGPSNQPPVNQHGTVAVKSFEGQTRFNHRNSPSWQGHSPANDRVWPNSRGIAQAQPHYRHSPSGARKGDLSADVSISQGQHPDQHMAAHHTQHAASGEGQVYSPVLDPSTLHKNSPSFRSQQHQQQPSLLARSSVDAQAPAPAGHDSEPEEGEIEEGEVVDAVDDPVAQGIYSTSCGFHQPWL